METITYCESHLVNGEKVLATTHSTNPDWSKLDLCAECAAEYDSRPPVVAADSETDDAA